MMRVAAVPVPHDALLARYDAQAGHFTDAFRADVTRSVDLSAFVEAFYTTPLFRMERAVLRIGGYRSTDADAANLSIGSGSAFAVWTVEDRTATELLLTDATGATRSWFQVETKGQGTHLWFGSAVIAQDGRIPTLAKGLMPVHTLYSRLLLAAAVRRLGRNGL